jgi:hypothetical protein
MSCKYSVLDKGIQHLMMIMGVPKCPLLLTPKADLGTPPIDHILIYKIVWGKFI